MRRIVVDGLPTFTPGLEMSFPDAVPEPMGVVSPEQLMIAMTGVRAIPDVVAAPPGIVIPRVFAPFRAY